MRNRVNTALLAILALALLLRLISLDDHSLWYDEAFAVLFAEKGLAAMLYGTLTPVPGGAADIHPLLYYLTLNAWMALFGQSPFTVRLWSVLLGVATVALVYFIARTLFDRRTGLTAALLTAVFPFQVHYAQETRMYTLLALLLLATTLCYLRAVDWNGTAAAAPRRRLRWWVAFGVCAGLAMYTQQLAAFYLVALGLLPLFTRRRAHLTGMALGVLVALIVYAPWLVNIPSQLQKVNAYYWVTEPGLDKLVTTFYLFLTVYAEIAPPWSLLALMGALFLLLFGLIQAGVALRRPGRHSGAQRRGVGLALWLALLPPLLMWLVSQVQPVFLERSLITSAILLYVFLAWVLAASRLPRPLVGLLALIILMQVGIGLGAQYRLNSFPYSPVQPLLACVYSQWQPGDVIVHMNKLSALPGVYYGRQYDPPPAQRFLGDLPGAPEDTLARPTQEALQILADADIATAAGTAGRVWFVVYARAEAQYADSGRPELRDAQDWLRARYRPAGRLTFNDLYVYLYSAAGTAPRPC